MKFTLLILMLTFIVKCNAQSLDDYVQLGEYAKAIDGFYEIQNPTTQDELTLAKAYCAKGMTIKCLNTYKKALKNTNTDAFLTSKFKYAKLLKIQNYYKKADSVFTELLRIMPEHAEILYQKGKIADALNKDAFQQFYLDALLHDPKHIKAAHEASRFYMRIDNLKMAKMICLKTLDLVPNTPRLINLLAQISYREEDWQTSLNYIKKLETLKPDLPKFIYDIKGNIYLKLNELEAAVKAFQKAFSKDNEDYKLCIKIAEIYLYLNKPNKSIKYLMLYERMRDTSMWRFNFLMGKFYLQNQEYRSAFYQFQKSYDENINHEPSQYFRAVAADNFMEDKSKALDYYTNYIETYEDVEDAKYLELALRRETEIRRELFMKE